LPSSIILVDEIAVRLGQAIKRRRLAVGLTQEELAERSDMHWTYVSQIEHGRRNISVAALIRIGRALGVPASQLLAEAEVA
jgi:transcriptional regulator with XRE-family HTH domain